MKRSFALLFAFVVTIPFFAGCEKKKADVKPADAAAPATDAAAPATDADKK